MAKTAEKKTAPKNAANGRFLVIVESPAKAKTINKYLGPDYVVKASKGHVRDLPPHRYGIDPGRNFEPEYEVLASHERIVRELKEHAAKADIVYLATDLDREGEAIAWHLAHALNLPPEKIRRVMFNEITKSAIIEAFKNPLQIDVDKVDAQQARRVLDRIVGYELSPLLWKKVAKGLSAGRVQSVAVRLIVDREAEIRAFIPEEYWTVDGVFAVELAKAATLADVWSKFAAQEDDKGNGPTQKQRFAWLAENNGLEAELVEINGQAFKPTGRLDQSKPVDIAFASAAPEVRAVVDALGFKVQGIDEAPWEDYARLGLRRVKLLGKVDPAKAPPFRVESVETKRTTSKAPGPFTTSTLQQAAANQLRFNTSRTMKIAQALYEGVDIGDGEGSVGLITYIRTDSTNLSAESVTSVRDLIGKNYGDKYLPEKPNRYASGKKAQEAHEAIRPTDPNRTPDALVGHISPEQHKLYSLIWRRFVACQMTPAQWDATTVLIAAEIPGKRAVFKATGRVLVFDGFYKVAGTPDASTEQTLPTLKTQQPVAPLAIEPAQKFTAPPPRFTEASLVKTLEAEGIGRPSTYASIIQTIQGRGYVEQVDRRFYATPRGETVTRKLVDHFPEIMNVNFTSTIEDELDKIAEQHLDWHTVLHDFYDPFKTSLARAHEEMQAVRAEPSEYTCQECGRPMVYRFGRKGRFLACTGYPECTVAKDVDRDGKVVEPIVAEDPCPKCGKKMTVRTSRRGPFLGCSGYPDCDQTLPCDETGRPLKKVEAKDLHEKCPACESPMEVKWFRGKSFMGCTRYPDCKETKPIPDGVYIQKPPPEQAGVRCDKCGRPMVIRKSRRGPFLSCSGFPKCRNAMPQDKLEHLRTLEAEGKIPPQPDEASGANGRNGRKTPARGGAKGRAAAKVGPDGKTAVKVDPKDLGPPPPGFAWTRTGRPVVEKWPEGSLTCPSCGGSMTLRTGRYGPFFSCAGCRNAVNLRGEAKKKAEAEMPAPDRPKPIDTDVACPDCGSKMMLRMGKTGRFLGCSGYPKCRKTMEAPPGLLREVAETAAK